MSRDHLTDLPEPVKRSGYAKPGCTADDIVHGCAGPACRILEPRPGEVRRGGTNGENEATMLERISDWAVANGGTFTRTRGKMNEVDGYIHRDGRIVAVVEAKHREYVSTDFDTFRLDVGKAYALHSRALTRGCRGLLIVEWADGVMEFARFDADNDPHLKPWKRERFTPSAHSKSEGKHERVVVNVPRSEFTTIHTGW